MKRGHGGKNKGQAARTSKPFCDCQYCECQNCPDVLQKLALGGCKENKTACRSKGPKQKRSSGSSVLAQAIEPPRRPSILDSLNPDRLCDCEIMARAIRSHIHMNIGMSERRNSSRHSEDKRPSYSRDTN